MGKMRRKQVHTTKTPEIIVWQNERYIEAQKMSGETVAAPALPIDIILARLEVF
jgi:hypothetical protein